MTHLLDRAYQRRILEVLRDSYPETVNDIDGQPTSSRDQRWTFNACYLAELGLLDVRKHTSMGPVLVHSPVITARGIDFLEADGGLTATLGVVTVRFEAETLKALLASKIESSELPEDIKTSLKKKLQELGSDALSEVSKRLLNAALDHWPAALQQFQALIS